MRTSSRRRRTRRRTIYIYIYIIYICVYVNYSHATKKAFVGMEHRKCRPWWCSSKATKVGSARYTYIRQEFKSQAKECCNLNGNPAHHFQTVFTRAAMIFNIHAVFSTISKHTHIAECQITVVLEWSRMPNYLRT